MLKLIFLAESWHIVMTLALIDVRYHVCSEINNLFKVFWCHIKQVTQTGGHTLEIPNMGNGRCEFNVPHALTAHFRAGHFHATAFAYDSLVARALILAASALPISGWTKNLFTKQTIFFRLKSTIVDRLRLRHCAVAPGTNVLRCGERNMKLIKKINVEHFSYFRLFKFLESQNSAPV
ncbi:Uncharacterised protein [Chlamydia trachomatis]|nr:Uncharacterised protein [Chlamydia trachomatis]